MISPPVPENEKARLAKLYEYSLLDTLEEEEFDQITRMASKICGTPISLISLIDKDRQWFKSKVGLPVPETPREFAFCAHAINDPKNALVVPDSRKDERFQGNPLVDNDPNVVFYAGFPLASDDLALGTLCVIDHQPRELEKEQLEALETLANQVVKLFELRRSKLQLERTVLELQTQNKSLEEFARVAAHDIKSPLANIYTMVDLLQYQLESADEQTKDLLEMIQTSAKSLSELIDGILKMARSSSMLAEDNQEFDLEEMIEDTFEMLNADDRLDLQFESEHKTIFANKVALQQILLNLLTNAVKYNNNPQPKVVVRLKQSATKLLFEVEDNGPGIDLEDQERIFEIFQTTKNTDQQGSSGTGIGLATVRSLIQGLGGEISIHSEKGKGARFSFNIPLLV